MMTYVLARGRPRIDVGLVMSYTAIPRPPGQPSALLTPCTCTVGNPNETYNPWLNISASVIHAPDAHMTKAIRTLYYAAQHYGHKKARDLAGCDIMIDEGRREDTLPGISELDGPLFVRTAGVVMNTFLDGLLMEMNLVLGISRGLGGMKRGRLQIQSNGVCSCLVVTVNIFVSTVQYNNPAHCLLAFHPR